MLSLYAMQTPSWNTDFFRRTSIPDEQMMMFPLGEVSVAELRAMIADEEAHLSWDRSEHDRLWTLVREIVRFPFFLIGACCVAACFGFSPWWGAFGLALTGVLLNFSRDLIRSAMLRSRIVSLRSGRIGQLRAMIAISEKSNGKLDGIHHHSLIEGSYATTRTEAASPVMLQSPTFLDGLLEFFRVIKMKSNSRPKIAKKVRVNESSPAAPSTSGTPGRAAGAAP